MELTVLDTDFNAIKEIDSFSSLIWAERYYACGDFEIFSSINDEIIKYLTPNNYLILKDSDYHMIIEDWNITTDFEDGNNIKITGRSVESILDRRIVWFQTTLQGNLQDTVELLLNENVIEPIDQNRKISNFIFEKNLDPDINLLNIDMQVDGETLYDTIVNICFTYSIGFRIRVVDGVFVFKLYSGKDRSYNQTDNEFVIFSTEFENLLNTNYIESTKPLKTYAIVAGEGDGTDKKKISVSITDQVTELDRREIYVDAGDISVKTDTGPLTDEEYVDLLTQRGVEVLTENSRIDTFEGQADTRSTFLYGVHYFIGDIVQIENEYGMMATARATELIRTQDKESGINTYPTFTNEKDEPVAPNVEVLVEGVRGHGNIDGGMAQTIYGGIDGIVGGDAYGS